jgi:hypothetical protein
LRAFPQSGIREKKEGDLRFWILDLRFWIAREVFSEAIVILHIGEIAKDRAALAARLQKSSIANPKFKDLA